MIITLACLIIVLVGAVVLNKVIDSFDHDGACILSLIAVSFGGVGLAICVCVIAVNHIFETQNIHSAEMKRESLVKQLEIISSDYEDVSKSKVIFKVYDWNSDVYDVKMYSENPVTSWFYSKKYVDSLKYIDIDDYLPRE